MQLWPFTTLQKKKNELRDYNLKERYLVELMCPSAPIVGFKRINRSFISCLIKHSVLNKFSFFSSLDMRPQGLLSRAGLGCDLNAIT